MGLLDMSAYDHPTPSIRASCKCPLLALSGQSSHARVCPLLDNSGQSRISAQVHLSAFDPKRTSPN